MDLNIRFSPGIHSDATIALQVKQHDGPAWIHGLTTITEFAAKKFSDHRGELHLPDLVRLSAKSAALLAQHNGAVHLDSLEHISDDGLRALIPHPNLWIPEDINERINSLCKKECEVLGREEDENNGDEDDEDNDDQSNPYAEDYSRPDDEWSDEANEDAYEDEEEEGDGDSDDGEHVSRDPEVRREAARDSRRGSDIDVLLRPLESLVGLEEVKKTIRSVVSLARVAQHRRRAGLSVAGASYHMVFLGPPGTGKTTVARLVASILREAGVLDRGHLVETDGQGLVAKYLGQTGHRVREIVERSLGGVLFIDEAYSLAPRDGSAGAYVSEAIATLVPLLETHREDLVVILAGYAEEMNELFTANPGLRSRFAHHLAFPPMNIDQLQAVYEQLAAEHGYLLSTRFKAGARYAIDRECRIRGQRFANARAVRTLFEATLRKQAERLAAIPVPTVADLQTLLLEDLPERVN